jgi:DNA-binding MarR family transcriptional regulator
MPRRGTFRYLAPIRQDFGVPGFFSLTAPGSSRLTYSLYMSRQLLSQHEPIGILVGAVYRRIKRVAAVQVRRHGMTSQQALVLVAVHEREGASLGEIAARIRMDQPTASRIVTALMKRRLVRIDPDPDDRRRARLCLAPGGRKLSGELYAVANEIRAAGEAGFSMGDQRTLRRLLHRVIANIDRYEREKRRGPGTAGPPKDRA